MAVMFPEHTLRLVIEAALVYINADLATHVGDETKSWLYSVLGGIEEENVDYFKEAKEFIKKYGDQTKKDRLRIKLGYDFGKSENAVINIILPSEQEDLKAISTVGSYEVLPDSAGNVLLNEARYNCEYIILVSTLNMNTTIILHKVLHCIFIGLRDNFELRGLQNLTVSNRDVHLAMDVPPPKERYHRGLMAKFFYEMQVRSLIQSSFADDFTSEGSLPEST